MLKPRLYGSSLGISGLLVLTAIIVGGRIAGLWGILLAVPAGAILDYLYSDCFLPWLENRRKRRIDEEAAQTETEGCGEKITAEQESTDQLTEEIGNSDHPKEPPVTGE